MNKTEESRITMTGIAVKTAVAAERERIVAIIEHAYGLTNGAAQGLIPLALAMVKLGRPVDESKRVLDVAAESTTPLPAPNATEEYMRQWTENPTPEASA